MNLTHVSLFLPVTALTGLAAAQANDDCGGAISVTVGTTAFDNTGATTSSPAVTCEPTFGQADLWYSFVPPTTQPYRFETCGSSPDTIIEVFEGTCAANTVVGCNDDACGLQSVVLVPTNAGTQYLVRVAGWNGDTGPGTLTISASSALPNDECAGALSVGVGSTVWDNTGATTSSPPFACEPTQGQVDLWYRFNAPTSASYIFETCGSSIDTVLEVFAGSCAGASIACNDDGCGTSSSLAATLTAGTDYLVRIGGFGGDQGPGSLDIRLSPISNDECAGALPATLGVNAFDNTGASTSSPPFPCELVQGQRDVWFEWTAPATATYVIDTCGSLISDTVLEVIEGSCAGGVSIGCNDDFCDFLSEVTFPATAGTSYKIRIGGWGGEVGPGVFTITEFTPPPLALAAHYPLDETGGSLATDASGNGAFGTYNNVQLGQPGADPNTVNSAGFDGSTSYVDIPGTSTLDELRTSLSVCAWVNVDALPPTFYRIFGNRFGGVPSGSWSFGLSSTGLVFTAHNNEEFLSSPAGLTPNTWHHVAVVYDEVNDATFYVDGVANSFVMGSEGTSSPLSEYYIGTWDPNSADSQSMDGLLDDIQVYRGTLSASEVSMLFNSPGLTLGAAAIGTPYCTPAVANSTGVPGSLEAFGSTMVGLNNVTLVVNDLPTQSFGFFLVSRTPGFVPGPGGSQGNLCLSGAIGRYVGPGQIQNTGADGEFSLMLDLMNIPSPTGFISATAGDVFNFQTWHRDSIGGTATSNFTNGVEITFL